MKLWQRHRMAIGTAVLVLAVVLAGWRYGEDRTADNHSTAVSLCEQNNLALEQINAQADWVAGILGEMSVLVDGDPAGQRAIANALTSRPPPPTIVPDCSAP